MKQICKNMIQECPVPENIMNGAANWGQNWVHKCQYVSSMQSHQRVNWVQPGKAKIKQRSAKSRAHTQVYYSELTQLYVARRLNITLLREKYMRLNEVIHLACNKLFAGGNLIFERSETNFGEIKMTLVVCRLNLLPALVESILTPGRSQASATLPLKSFRPR